MPPAPNDPLRDRPFLILATSHWLSLLGMALVGTALISWLFVLPLQVRGHVDNPYIGIVVFMVVPVVLVAGLGMVPVGVWLARRRAKQRLTEQIVDRQAAIRRLVEFGGAVALINVVVGTQGTYRAVERGAAEDRPCQQRRGAFPGCFRCHDEEHKTADGRTMTQDCGACHEAVATEESSPEVLETLGLEARILALRKPKRERRRRPGPRRHAPCLA